MRKARERKGWSQLFVAQKSGISNTNISNYERDYREPDAETLHKLAELYDVTTDYLISGLHAVTGSTYKKDVSVDGSFSVGELRDIEIVAEIPCGTPILTEENIIGVQPVDISVTNLNGGKYVWLRAKGDSMIKAKIFNGSLVLLRLQPDVDDGDICAVCVDHENATLKRVYVNGDSVILSPENDGMSPASYEKSRVRIVGKAIKVLSTL